MFFSYLWPSKTFVLGDVFFEQTLYLISIISIYIKCIKYLIKLIDTRIMPTPWKETTVFKAQTNSVFNSCMFFSVSHCFSARQSKSLGGTPCCPSSKRLPSWPLFRAELDVAWQNRRSSIWRTGQMTTPKASGFAFLTDPP